MSQPAVYTVGLTVVAIALTALLAYWGRKFMQPDSDAAQVRLFGAYSPLLTWAKYRRLPRLNSAAFARTWRGLPWGALAELGLISVFALWVGRVYLTGDIAHWLVGDWPLNVQGYFPWTWFAQCGACVLWNGSMNGGYPAFVELVAAMLHPAVVVAVVLTGALTASKLMVVMGFLMAGWAQWWLGRSLRFGALTRLWTAALAITGGHLAGRLASGLTEEVFSAAACSLALAAAVDLALTGRRRAVAALGLTLGLAVLSGQGYMQIALITCLFPGLVLFVFTGRLQLRPLFRSFLVAALLAVLVSAVLWVPLLHFWPNFSKPTAEANFAAQLPPGPLLLNLVISNPDYYAGLERGGLIPSAAWQVNYVGWLPVLLAGVGLRFAPRRCLRLVAFAVFGLSLLYLVAGATILRWLAPFSWAAGLVTLVRTPSVMTSMAVPLVLLLAGLGLEALWRLTWPRLSLVLSAPVNRSLALNPRWLLLVPLLWSVQSTYDFGHRWMAIDNAPLEYYAQLGGTGVAGQQWVESPYSESTLVVVSLQSGLKVTNYIRPWTWKGREQPPVRYRFTRDAVDPTDPALVSVENGVSLTVNPAVNYAAVTADGAVVPCAAQALGGNIDVTCDLPTAGVLVVAENAWSGWSARRDGRPVPLIPDQWLSVSAPAGVHHFQFRYRPWDVTLGLGLSLLGLLGCLAVFFHWRWPAVRPPAARA